MNLNDLKNIFCLFGNSFVPNVGIGTTAPDAVTKLNIHGGADAWSWLKLTNNATGVTNSDGLFLGFDAGGAALWNEEPTAMRFGTSGSERMRIAANGSVGIGTNNPVSRLHVHYAGANAEVATFSTTGGWAETTTSNGTNWTIVGADGSRSYIKNETAVPIAFDVFSVEKMRLQTSGGLAIGTTTSSAILDAYGTGSLSSIIVPRDTTALRPTGVNGMIRYNTTNLKFEVYEGRWQNMLSSSGAGDNLGNHTATQPIIATTGAVGGPAYTFNSDTDTGLWSPSVGILAASTNGTERMRIAANGSIGLGTNNPTSQLHIVKTDTSTSSAQNPVAYLDLNTNPGAASTADTWGMKVTNGYGSASNLTSGGIRGAEYAAYKGGTGNVNALWGFVAQGANYATGTLSNAIANYSYVQNTSTGTISNAKALEIEVKNTGGGTVTNGYGLYITTVQATNKFAIYSADSTVPSVFAGGMTIGSTTAPAYRLEVRDSQATNAAAMIYNTNTGGSAEGLRVQIDATTPGTSNAFASFKKSGGTTIGSITGDGAGGVQYNLASDRRLKDHIRDTHYSIEDLMKIRVRDYVYKTHNVETNGFIAQELYEAYPPAVSKPVDESKQYWQVDYGRLTPLIVKAVQDVNVRCEMTASQQAELQARVASAERDIASLKREVQSLRDKNEQLERKLNKVMQHLKLDE